MSKNKNKSKIAQDNVRNDNTIEKTEDISDTKRVGDPAKKYYAPVVEERTENQAETDARASEGAEAETVQEPTAQKEAANEEAAGEAAEEAELEAAAEAEAAPFRSAADEAPSKTEKTPVPDEGDDYSAAEGTDARLLSEFAPKPIDIPNVNLEKEKKKQEKRRKNRVKDAKKVAVRKSKKNKKRSKAQKAVFGIISFILFLILTVSMTGFISVLSVQTATSRYAFTIAVKNMDTPNITIGEIKDNDALGIVKSSRRGALVDIIRDNSNLAITYKDITSALRSSDMEEFLADRMKSAADYLLRGGEYSDLTGSEIADVIKSGSTVVSNLTGRVLTDEDYAAIAEHFDTYGRLDQVSRDALSRTVISEYTPEISKVMSLPVLGGLLLLVLALIILLCIFCRESTYLPMGWSFILSGLAVVAAAILFRPSYNVASEFLESVISSYFGFFTVAVIIIAAVFTVVGALIFLIGNAAADKTD